MNRRGFVVGTAAAGAGLALGFDLPFGGPTVVRAADGAPEVNAWVVIRRDDTVVIRIARSEMGQGSLTGLAQLVAEELECDWTKVTTEYPTPGQSAVRKRVWGSFSTGGSIGIRASQQYVRQGGAAARMMLMQAAANEWKVPVAECTAATSVITHTPTGRTTTYGRVAEAAAKLEAPADVKLKDPRDWKIAGKSVKPLDTSDKTTGKMIYGIDVKLPGMLSAAIKACPVFGGKLKSFDEAKIAGMKGVKKVVRVGDNAVAVIADTWWHAKTALDALPIVWDEGDNAKVSSASIAKWLEEGLDETQPAFVGNINGDAKTAIASAARKIEAVYDYPYQNHAALEPLNATVLYTPDRCEVWTGTQDGELAFTVTVQASGLPPREMRCPQGDARRRLRPSHRARLCPAGGPDRQADAGHAGQAAVVTRRGHDARQISSGHPVQADRRVRCRQQSDWPAYADLGPVGFCQHHAPGAERRHGPVRVPGPLTTWRGVRQYRTSAAGLHRPPFADRPFHAQSSCSAGCLARRQRQPERDLSRMLHG